MNFLIGIDFFKKNLMHAHFALVWVQNIIQRRSLRSLRKSARINPRSAKKKG